MRLHDVEGGHQVGHLDLQNHGCVGGQGLLKGGVKTLGFGPHPHRTKGLGQKDEVRVVQVGADVMAVVTVGLVPL